MNTFDKVTDLIKDTMNIEDKEFTKDTNLFDDLGFDSIAAFELVAAMEDEFGITIPDEDTSELKTIGNIVDYIDSHSEGC